MGDRRPEHFAQKLEESAEPLNRQVGPSRLRDGQPAQDVGQLGRQLGLEPPEGGARPRPARKCQGEIAAGQ